MKLHFALCILQILAFLLPFGSISAQEKVAARKPQYEHHFRLMDATMDITNGIVQADKVQLGTNLPQAFNGNGVVLTVADIGFDFTHPNFELSKIVGFWDLLSRDTIDQEHVFTGHEYTNEQEIRALQHSYDGKQETHATHVLGIAAGTGAKEVYGSDEFRGIASGADLLLVGNVLSNNAKLVDSIQRPKFEGLHEFDIFKYAFDYAESVGKPCVINMSSGRRQSFGDDFPIYNQMIDELTGPGKIIVASSGNNGKQKVYMKKREGQASVQSWYHPAASSGNYLFFRHKGDCKLELFCRKSKESEFQPMPTDLYATLDTISDYDGTPIQYIILQDSIPQKTGLRLYARMSGTADSEGELFTQGVQFLDEEEWSDGEYDYSVIFPGSYDNVICVGYSNYREGYTTAWGDYYTYDQGEMYKANIHTSRGPRLDGYQKPDIVAPGAFVVSSFNSFYEEENADDEDVLECNYKLFDHNGRRYSWSVMSGSSMSTPVVSGIIALWLEANPKLTPQDIKDIFKRTARHPDPTLSYPNAIYGYGEIDAYAGLLDILGVDKIEGVSKDHARNVKFVIKEGEVKAFNKQTNEPLHIIIYSTSGARMPEGKLAPGVYAVEVVTDKAELKGSTLVRI